MLFSWWIQILDFLYKNLGFAAPSTVRQWFHSNFDPVIEGQARVHELGNFLSTNNLPTIVWGGEDATRLIGKVSYNSTIDEIVGLVKLCDPVTGLPFEHFFPAKSFDAIEVYTKKHAVADYVNTFMVKPICEDAATFALLSYGTDTKFASEEVLARMSHIEKLLRDNKIVMIGYSTDAASPYLKAQKIKLGYSKEVLPTNLPSHRWFEWWACDFTYDILIPLQDALHEVAKNKNRLLSPKCNLKIGYYNIAITDLKV